MLISPLDNVDINLEDGHKYALRDIAEGENIIKYGNPIGHAICDIKKGEHVHTHNIKTNLAGNLEYTYEPVFYDIPEEDKNRTFMGYVRENGDVGIRNEIWIVNTVGCVNKVAEEIAKATGARCFPHPFGCSQLGDDNENIRKLLVCNSFRVSFHIQKLLCYFNTTCIKSVCEGHFCRLSLRDIEYYALCFGTVSGSGIVFSYSIFTCRHIINAESY